MTGLAVRVLALTLLASCGNSGGAGAVGSDCHGGDCDVGLDCAGPNDPTVCGIPPREECANDGDCGTDRCHAIVDSCSRDGIGSECRPACSGDTCGAGLQCDQGRCVAILCDAGYACLSYQVCDLALIGSAPIYDLHHGCFGIGCAADIPCDGGRFCVNGSCQDDLGTCEQPMAVPRTGMD